ncbi:hypothetical protein ACQEVC_45355 [Plantactinospora sp. CA-294935]
MGLIPRDFVSRLVYKVVAVATAGAVYAALVNFGAITQGAIA